jgi:hypothetical protein
MLPIALTVPYVFISYAHGTADHTLLKFVEDIGTAMQGKFRCDAKTALFVDVSAIRVGDTWATEIEQAIATCKCFVALLSPSYLLSKDCGREWAAFSARLQSFRRRLGGAGGPPPLLLPVMWQRVTLPEKVATLQWTDGSLGDAAATGLRHLIHRDANQYSIFRDVFCARLHEIITTYDLPPAVPPFRLERMPDPFTGSRGSRPRWVAASVAATLLGGVAFAIAARDYRSHEAARRSASVWVDTMSRAKDPKFLPEPPSFLADLADDDLVASIEEATPEAPGAARVLLDEAIRRRKGEPKVWMLDGSWYYQMGSYELARDSFSHAIELDAGAEAYLSRAKCKRQLGDDAGYGADRAIACQRGARGALCDAR